MINDFGQPMPIKIGMCVGAAYLGLQAPMLFLKNADLQAPALDQARAFPMRSICC